MKKAIAIVLTVLILLTLLSACEINFGIGSVITVSEITGSNAAIVKNNKSGQDAAKGAEITAGCRLMTGEDTCVYLKVDEDSIIKMNENSEINVTEISSSVLKFDLLRGSVLINENGKDGRLHMTAGSVSLIVRGTFFIANYEDGSMTVDLIEGKIDVKTDSGEVTNVGQGSRVTVDGNSDAVVETLDVLNFDAFTMDSVMEYKEVLTDGSLTDEDFSYIYDYAGGWDAIYDETYAGDINYDGSPVYDDSVMGDWGDAPGEDAPGEDAVYDGSPVYDDSVMGDWGDAPGEDAPGEDAVHYG